MSLRVHFLDELITYIGDKENSSCEADDASYEDRYAAALREELKELQETNRIMQERLFAALCEETFWSPNSEEKKRVVEVAAKFPLLFAQLVLKNDPEGVLGTQHLEAVLNTHWANYPDFHVHCYINYCLVRGVTYPDIEAALEVFQTL